MSNVLVVPCAGFSSDLVFPRVLWSCVPVVAPILCFHCSDDSVWSLIGPLVLFGQRSSSLVCTNVSWSYGFSYYCEPFVSLMLCTHCSFFLKRLLFLSVQCSPAPVCPVFLRVCVPKGPLVHCAQSPMVLKTCCFSDALCPLLLNPTVTLTDPLVTGHWSTVSLFLSSHRSSGLFSGPV